MLRGTEVRDSRPSLVDRYPFTSFPSGWFAVAWNADLEVGQARPEHLFGRDVVVFKTASGDVRVLDAVCPHLGAHLGHGGCVEGETLRCPFHGWRFDGDGSCVEVPNAAVPKGAEVASWPVRLLDGMVMVWHDASGGAPTWEPEPAAWDGWTAPQLIEEANWVLRMHPQEIAENGVDIAHLPEIHKMDGPRIVIAPDFSGPVASWQLTCGTAPQIDVYVNGLGRTQVDTLMADSDARVRVQIYATPIDGEHIRVRAPLAVLEEADPTATEATFDFWKAVFPPDFEKDIEIWERKAYKEHPVLSAADGPIIPFRRWATQFY